MLLPERTARPVPGLFDVHSSAAILKKGQAAGSASIGWRSMPDKGLRRRCDDEPRGGSLEGPPAARPPKVVAIDGLVREFRLPTNAGP
jgi:hypothetical protein